MRSNKKTVTQLGKAIRKQRAAMELTQAQLAQFAGCGVIFVHQLESGKPTARFDKILDVLGVLGLQMAVRVGTPVFAVDNPLK